MVPVKWTRRASRELGEAVDWYRSENQVIAEDFKDKIEEAVARVRESPERFPLFHRVFRRLIVQRFPYSVIYEWDGKVVVIAAIWHARRDPRSFLRIPE